MTTGYGPKWHSDGPNARVIESGGSLEVKSGGAITVDAGGTFTNAGAEVQNGTLTRAPGASTAAAGSTKDDAAALPAGTAAVYPTTAADDTKGVIINAADKVTGREIRIGNGVSNKILKIYPPAGGTINGAGADVAFSTSSGKGAVLYCLNATANTWFAW